MAFCNSAWPKSTGPAASDSSVKQNNKQMILIGAWYRLSCMKSRLVRTLLLLPAIAAVLFAQATSVVQISGVVSDGAGGVVPTAKGKALQTDTGLERSATVESDGS